MTDRMMAARIHATTREHARKLARARGIVAKALAVTDDWYVALSGGKDSTAVLGLVREVEPDTPAVWSDDVFYLPETAEYMERVGGLHHIRTNATHTSWFSTEGDWDGVGHFAEAALGRSAVFLGLRADENSYRRVHLRSHGVLYRTRAGIWQCNPVAWWSWLDVWAYIVSHGLDYNHAYDRLAEIGVQPARQRIGPYATERALGYGQLEILRRGWPAEYRRFVAAHPEARDHA